MVARCSGSQPLISPRADQGAAVALAELIRATGVVVRAGLPDEVVVVLGEQVRAAAPVAHVAEHLMPGAVDVLTLRERRNLGHQASPLAGRRFLDAMPGESSREASPELRFERFLGSMTLQCGREGR